MLSSLINSFKSRKAYQIAAFLLAAFLFGFLIYKFFFQPIAAPTVTPPSGTSTPEGRLPEIDRSSGKKNVLPEGTGTLPSGETTVSQADEVAMGSITRTEEVITQESRGLKLSGDGTSLEYYNPADGRFYRISQDGSIELLSDVVFHEVENIYWDAKGQKAVIEYPDGANILYNFQTKKQSTLPSHWEEFGFSPSGDQIVMKSLGLDENNRWLAIANPDGSGARSIKALGNNGGQVYPSWSPNKQTVAMFMQPTGFDQQEIYFIGLNDENFKSLTVPGRGFKPLWSPNGKRLVYSVYSSKSDLKPTLWAADAQGETIGRGSKNLNTETWADKCVYSDNETIYCAVPDVMEQGAGIYPELADGSTEKLYEINTYTGQKKLIAVPETQVSMRNLILAGNGSWLYYSDPDGKTYRIRLK